jgi:hypothetical protein
MTKDNFVAWSQYYKERTTVKMVDTKEKALRDVENAINKLKEQGLI